MTMRLAASGLLDQHGELVATEPGHRVGRAQAALNPAGDLDEDPVAGAMADAVVDALEIVEIEEQDHRRCGAPTARRQGVIQTVDEQGPVGEVGEGIVERGVVEAHLQRLALGDVAHVDDQALEERVIERIRDDRLDVDPAAVPGLEPPLGR